MSMVQDTPGVKLVDEANASGFPLQLAVKREIQRCAGGEWVLRSEEFPWRDERTGAEGHVDLLVSNGMLAFVIECKRRAGGNWTFLVPPEGHDRTDVSLVVAGDSNPVQCLNWTGGFPKSFLAMHCVVPGSGDRKRTLDAVANELVVATECIAREHANAPWPLAFIPMIVCTPRPAVVHVDVEALSVAEGVLPRDAAVEYVSHVLFRKSFHAWTTAVPSGLRTSALVSEPMRPLLSFAEDRERTVLVVHSGAVQGLLESLHNIRARDVEGVRRYWNDRLVMR